MNKKLQFYLTIIPLIITGCNFFSEPENNEQLTAATNTGAQTFSCKVNGKVWIPYTDVWGTSPAFETSYAYRNYPRLHFTAKKLTVDEKFDDFLIFECDSVLSTGSFPIKQAAFTQEHPIPMVYSKLVGSNYVNITHLDTVQRIISGTFALVLKDTSGRTVNITDGRFDTKYHP